MRYEDLDEILKREPSWEPPRGFARTVIARMSARAPGPLVTERHSGLELLHAAQQGVLATAVGYLGGHLLWWGAPLAADRATTVVDAYVAFMERVAAGLVTSGLPIAWMCAAFSLAMAASFMRRARVWM